MFATLHHDQPTNQPVDQTTNRVTYQAVNQTVCITGHCWCSLTLSHRFVFLTLECLYDVATDVNMSDRVVELYFKQLNRTISTMYCTNSNCRQQSGGNYTYAVPLSARFPPLFITITFK